MSALPSLIRVVLVENHTLVRVGIRRLLEKLGNVEVLGEAGDGTEAVAMMEELAAAQNLPDIVLMDLGMPKMNGLEATERIMQEHPEVRIIILSMHTDEEHVLQALRAGAKGYLLKDIAPEDLRQALQDALSGEVPLSPLISRHVVADYMRRIGHEDTQTATVTAPPAVATSYQNLTPRQTEILRLITDGFTTKEIAARLNVSVKTVETHRAALMNRLDIHDVAGLVRYAIRTGIVPAGE